MKQLELDQHGHLKDKELWSKQLAVELAMSDDIQLSDDHWKVIYAVRDIYAVTDETPPMRLLIKELNKRIDSEITSRFLYRLYPDGPVRYASKHAGLPKPKHCM